MEVAKKLSAPAGTYANVKPVEKLSAEQFTTLLEKYQGNAYESMLEDLGRHLGVSADSLRKLAPGFAPIVPFAKGPSSTGFWVFPERDAHGNVEGLSLRTQDDKKFMYPGSKHGLIYAVNPEHEAGGGGYNAGASNWIRTMDAGIACPVCGKPDGCLLSAENPADPKAVVCIRVREGAEKRLRFGSLHIRKAEGKLAKSVSALSGDPSEYVLVVEGMSDTAAAMDLGFAAVGRPSNLACMDELKELVRGRRVLVIGENDAKSDGRHPGRDGVNACVKTLAVDGVASEVVSIFPPKPYKDLRAAKVVGGLTRAKLLADVEKYGKIHELKPAAVERSKGGQSDTLIELARGTGVELFRCDDRGYASVTVISGEGTSRRETYAIKGEAFATWLRMIYYRANEKSLADQTVKDAASSLNAMACFDGSERPVSIRLAYVPVENAIYVDMLDEAGRAIKVTEHGREIVANPESVRFLRRAGMLPLPMPVDGGSLDELRPLINAADNEVWVLYVAWLVSTYNPRGALPILGLRGPQGCGKSSASEMASRLLDDNEMPLRFMPKTERDLAVAARNAWVLGFDNSSNIPPEFSDALCGVSSGSGFATRANYTDDAEARFKFKRPILINGIPEVVSREDLKDRSLLLALSPIDKGDRRSECWLRTEFERVRPRVFGALLDAVSMALRNWDSVELSERPRLADFVQWVVAAEPALPWEPGTFERLYADNRAESSESSIEASAVAAAIISLMAHHATWSGTASDLLAALDQAAGSAVRSRVDFPKLPRGLSDALARVAPALAERGIIVSRQRKTAARYITLIRTTR